jgi:transposase-like protein
MLVTNSDNIPPCPQCNSTEVRKHGQHLGKQRWYCKSCGFAFTGAEYKHRPEIDIRVLKTENTRYLKIIKYAVSMRNAQKEFEIKQSGKIKTKKIMREERFDRLVKINLPNLSNLQDDLDLADIDSTPGFDSGAI